MSFSVCTLLAHLIIYNGFVKYVSVTQPPDKGIKNMDG